MLSSRTCYEGVEMPRASSFEHHVDIEIDVLILLASFYIDKAR